MEDSLYNLVVHKADIFVQLLKEINCQISFNANLHLSWHLWIEIEVADFSI